MSKFELVVDLSSLLNEDLEISEEQSKEKRNLNDITTKSNKKKHQEFFEEKEKIDLKPTKKVKTQNEIPSKNDDLLELSIKNEKNKIRTYKSERIKSNSKIIEISSKSTIPDKKKSINKEQLKSNNNQIEESSISQKIILDSDKKIKEKEILKTKKSKKSTKNISIEQESLDDFLKQIERNLDLGNFTSAADTYQKEINMYNESINENTILEELKEETPPKNLLILENKKEFQNKKKINESFIETRHLSEINQETIQTKSLEKENTHKVQNQQCIVHKEHEKLNEEQKLKNKYKTLKEFYHSEDRFPDKKKYKIKNFPKCKSEKTLNTELKKIYKDLNKFDMSDEEIVCDVCLDMESTDDNQILICDLCEASIHQSCYGSELKHFIPEGLWYCSRCKYLLQNNLIYEAVKCCFCPEIKGIIKMLNGSELLWGHVSCIHWSRVLSFNDEEKEYVDMEEIYNQKNISHCSLCDINYGICIKCDVVDCEESFHVTCAQRQGLIYYMEQTKKHIQTAIFCRNHRKNHIKQIQNEIQKKYLDYVENPNKYSLILPKQKYIWYDMPIEYENKTKEIKSIKQSEEKTTRNYEIMKNKNLENKEIKSTISQNENHIVETFLRITPDPTFNDEIDIFKDEEELFVFSSLYINPEIHFDELLKKVCEEFKTFQIII